MISSPVPDEVLCEDADVVLYRAQRDDGRTVLAKALKTERPSSAEYEALRREADAAKVAGADVAAEPEGVTTLDGRPTLLLRDDGAVSLARLLGAPLPLERFFPLVLALVEAIETIHARHLVHGDLHPEDILVLSDGRVEMIGFGQTTTTAQAPRPRPPASTWPYLSPEQTGRLPTSVDARSDLYAVGVLAYQMLAGRLPFEAKDIFGWFHAHCAIVPPPLSTVAPDVPAVLGRIVDKLLTKPLETRYQCASGLRHDLERCFSSWREHGEVEDFALGLADIPPPLRTTARVHGRRDEARQIELALERVRSTARVETVLVSGPAGIGKTCLVQEVMRRATAAEGRATVTMGTSQSAKIRAPGGAVLDALDGLLSATLESSPESPDAIRQRLEKALGINLPLLASLLPSLARVVGTRAPPTDAPIPETNARFLLALDQFIGAFSTHERPVVLVLDDLQWADAPTLETLTHWTLDEASPPMLVIGVYRSGDVTADHPLACAIERMREQRGALEEIHLEPLSTEAITAWVMDTLQVPPNDAEQLAGIIAERTGNNPLFAARYLESLRTKNRLHYATDARKWVWDIDALRAEPYTDDVAELIAANISALPPAAQHALGIFAAYGNSADLATLAVIFDCSTEEALSRLDGAFEARLIARADGRVRFLHDRIQQTAYERLHEHRPDVHLRIGRALLARLPPSDVEKRVFDIVGQFETASALLENPEERVRVAELELLAGQKAQQATRFAPAVQFLSRGVALLSEEHWETRHELAFELHHTLARSHLVLGNLDSARQLGTLMLARARTGTEQASVHTLRAELELLQGRFEGAVSECLVGLGALGVELPLHPTEEVTRAAASAVLERVLHEDAATILDLPSTTDPDLRAICDLISSLLAPAVMVDWNLVWLAAAAAVERSLAHGNTASSPIAYAALGVLLAKEGRYEDAVRIGEAAYALAKRGESAGHRPRASFTFVALLNYLSLPVRSCIELLRTELEVARALGDQSFACYLTKADVEFRFFAGDPLSDLDAAACEASRFVDRAGYPVVRDQIDSLRHLVRRLRGAPTAGSFVGDALEGRAWPLASFTFFTHEVIASFVRGDHANAVRLADRAEELADVVLGFIVVPELHFYAALARAASVGPGHDARPALARIKKDHAFLQGLASRAPSNFGAREALVDAELHRLEGDHLAAERGYEVAIGAARAAAQIHVEAFANERAASYYRARGMRTVADAYLAQAHACYEAWGATHKAARLADEFPSVTRRRMAPEDLGPVIKAQQAISSALRLPELHARLLQVALEHARARRACLLDVGSDQSITVAATSGQGASFFGEVGTPADPACLPLALCRSAMRLKTPVGIADALLENRYSFDPYFGRARIRAALCVPIVRQETVSALLYLENDLVPGAFSSDRHAVLDCIAGQAAISLENASLYSKLERENAERRLAVGDLAEKKHLLEAILDATPSLVFMKDTEGRYVLINRAFEELLHLDRTEFRGKTDAALFPREIAEHLRDEDRCVLDGGRLIESDQELALDDGTHSFFTTKFPIRDDADRIYAVCGISTDITDRKHAEEELRRSFSLVEATLESAADGILVTDCKGAVVRYNRRFVSMWRIPEDVIRTRDERNVLQSVLGQLIDPSDFLSKVDALYTNAEAEGYDKLHFKDGRVFERYSLPQRVAGSMVGRVWSFRDVTQRVRDAEERSRLLAEEQKARADAEEAVHVRDEFLSIASHELRTPLASLSLAVESLSTYLVEPINADRVRRSADIAKRQVQRIVSLVDMLLDISRLRSGKLVLSPARVDLRNIVADVAALLRTELARSGSELVVHASEPLVGNWDPLRLEQVVTNLLTNAIKFGRGKPIIVDLVRHDREAVLSVSDQGIGMPDERQSRIFEPFTRLVSSRHYGGLGLGLHITKTIVEAHGGTIGVETEEGRGSRFIVTLPLAQDSEELPRTDVSASGAAAPRRGDAASPGSEP